MSKRRRILKWTGLLLSVLILSVWVASMFVWASLSVGRFSTWVEYGRLKWDFSPSTARAPAPLATGQYFDLSGGWHGSRPLAGFPLNTVNQANYAMWLRARAPTTSSEVHCWIPLLIVALPTGFVYWRDRRPTKPGCCVSCGYNLTGTQHEKCPECGAAAEWRSPKPDRRLLQRVLKWTGLAACVLLVATWAFSWLWPHEGTSWVLHKGSVAHGDHGLPPWGAWSGVGLWLPLLGIGWATMMLWRLERSKSEHLKRARGRLQRLGLGACVLVAGMWLATGRHELRFRLSGYSTLSYAVSRGTIHRFSFDPRGVPVGLSIVSCPPWRIMPSDWWPEAGRTQLDIYYTYTPLWLLLVLIALPTYIVPLLAKRHPRGHCQWCGYNLTGAEHKRCPECDAAIPESGA